MWRRAMVSLIAAREVRAGNKYSKMSILLPWWRLLLMLGHKLECRSVQSNKVQYIDVDNHVVCHRQL